MSQPSRQAEVIIQHLRRNKNSEGIAGSVDLAASLEVDGRSDPTPPRRITNEFEVDRQVISNTVVFLVRAKRRRVTRAVLHVHGGGFIDDFSDDTWDIIAAIAKQSGAEVWAVAYRLAPRQTAETTVREAAEVYRELVSRWPPTKIAGVGDSAGGGLLLAAVQAAVAEGLPAISLLILISPWVDLMLADLDVDGAEVRDPMLDRGRLEAAARAYAGGLPLDDPRVSPIFGPLSHLPRVWILAGGDDTLVYQGRRLRNLLVDCKVPTNYSESAGMMHVFAYFPIPEGRRALRAAMKEIRRMKSRKLPLKLARELLRRAFGLRRPSGRDHSHVRSNKDHP